MKKALFFNLVIDFSTFLLYNANMTEKKKNILIYSILGAFVAITIACFCCINLIKVDDNSLSINCNSSFTIYIGESKDLDIKCSNEEAKIILSTSNDDIIEIDNLNVIGLTEGTAYINIEAKLNKETTNKNIKVIVKNLEEDKNNQEPIDLKISLENETTLYLLDKNYTKANSAGFSNFTYFSTAENVKYSLSKENIIIISSKKTATGTEGKITAHNVGEVVITFYSTEDNSIAENKTIKVEKISPNISLSDNNLTLTAEETKNLTYFITPSYYYGEALITAESSDTEIFTVTNTNNENTGNLTIYGNKKGQASLFIYVNGELNKTIMVEVNAKYIPTYTLVVSAHQDCTINNKEIHTTKNSCAIEVKVINDKQQIQDCNIQISGVDFTPAINYIVLYNLTNKTISFSCTQYDICENYSIIID